VAIGWFDRDVRGRTVAMSVAALVAVFLPVQSTASRFRAMTGEGLLDLGGGDTPAEHLFGYSPDHAYNLLVAYGPNGRRSHVRFTLLCDVPFPMALYICGSLMIRHAWQRPDVRRRLAIVPLAYLVADYAENAGILTMLVSYPKRRDAVARLTATANVAKNALVTSLVLAIASGYLDRLNPRRRRRYS